MEEIGNNSKRILWLGCHRSSSNKFKCHADSKACRSEVLNCLAQNQHNVRYHRPLYTQVLLRWFDTAFSISVLPTCPWSDRCEITPSFGKNDWSLVKCIFKRESIFHGNDKPKKLRSVKHKFFTNQICFKKVDANFWNYDVWQGKYARVKKFCMYDLK